MTFTANGKNDNENETFAVCLKAVLRVEYNYLYLR